AEDGIRDFHVTGVQTCALPIWPPGLRRVLPVGDRDGDHADLLPPPEGRELSQPWRVGGRLRGAFQLHPVRAVEPDLRVLHPGAEIGRASCRVRWWLLVVLVVCE